MNSGGGGGGGRSAADNGKCRCWLAEECASQRGNAGSLQTLTLATEMAMGRCTLQWMRLRSGGISSQLIGDLIKRT